MRPDSGTTDTANIWGRNAGASFPVEGQRNETWGGCTAYIWIAGASLPDKGHATRLGGRLPPRIFGGRAGATATANVWGRIEDRQRVPP